MKEAVARNLITEAVAKEYELKLQNYSKLYKCHDDYIVSHLKLCELANGDEDETLNDKMKAFITEDLPDYVKDASKDSLDHLLEYLKGLDIQKVILSK